MVFDIEGLSQARQAVRRELSRGNRGGSPNGNGGQGARHPLADGESGMVLPVGSAGGSAHEVVGPGSERADQGCVPDPFRQIGGQAGRSSELVKVLRREEGAPDPEQMTGGAIVRVRNP